jgi:hypothetical protein
VLSLLAKAPDEKIASVDRPDEDKDITGCHKLRVLTCLTRFQVNDKKHNDSDRYHRHKYSIEHFEYSVSHGRLILWHKGNNF